MTSSAVVGSSPMTICRVAGEGHGDHRPLAHAARQLVRVGRRRAACGMPTSSSSSPARDARRVLALAQPDLDGLGDLVAHPADRVERVHRALEDDADLAPAVAVHAPSRSSGEVDAVEVDAARADARRSRAAGAPATGRSSSCRSPTRRRCPAPRPSSSRKLTPSTALTEPLASLNRTARPRTSSIGAVGSAERGSFRPVWSRGAARPGRPARPRRSRVDGGRVGRVGHRRPAASG